MVVLSVYSHVKLFEASFWRNYVETLISSLLVGLVSLQGIVNPFFCLRIYFDDDGISCILGSF